MSASLIICPREPPAPVTGYKHDDAGVLYGLVHYPKALFIGSVCSKAVNRNHCTDSKCDYRGALESDNSVKYAALFHTREIRNCFKEYQNDTESYRL